MLVKHNQKYVNDKQMLFKNAKLDLFFYKRLGCYRFYLNKKRHQTCSFVLW